MLEMLFQEIVGMNDNNSLFLEPDSCVLYVSPDLIPTKPLSDRFCDYPPFSDEETGAQGKRMASQWNVKEVKHAAFWPSF